MKRIVTLVVGLSLVSAARADEGAGMDIPSFDQMANIRMRFGEWNGRFSPDGSGGLQYSNDSMGFASTPKESFSFEDIYNLLVPHLHRNRFDGGTMFVRLNRIDKHPVREMYLSDKEVMRTLMYGLRDKSVPWVIHYFEKILSTHPLVPGDEPTPFKYDYPDKEAYYAAMHTVWGPPMEIDIPFNGGMPKNWVAVSSPNPETPAPDYAGKETSADPAVVEVAQDEGGAQASPPPSLVLHRHLRPPLRRRRPLDCPSEKMRRHWL